MQNAEYKIGEEETANGDSLIPNNKMQTNSDSPAREPFFYKK